MTDFTPEFIEQQLELAEKSNQIWFSGDEVNKLWSGELDVLRIRFRDFAKNHYPDALREIQRLQKENAEKDKRILAILRGVL